MASGPAPRRLTEVFDGDLPLPVRAAELDDVDRLNRWFGGYALTLSQLKRAARAIPNGRPWTVVEVGGGRADFATWLVRWARRHGRPVRVLVVDAGEDVLAMARRVVEGYPEIMLLRADATALPLRPRCADVATAALLFHHLDPPAVVATMSEMRAAARTAVIVNDLARGWLSLALVWVATRLFAVTPMARHDGPVSVKRAYSGAELRRLAEQAGIRRFTIRVYPFLARLVAVGQ